MKRSLLGMLCILAAGAGAFCYAQAAAPAPADVFEFTFVVGLPHSDSEPVAKPDSVPAPPKTDKTAGAAPAKTAEPATVNVIEPVTFASRGPRIWGGFDYLMYWVRKGSTPPLVVTGSPADPFPGALDQPNTRVLFGDHGLDYGRFSGLRLDLGAWLDRDERIGLEASGFVLERRSAHFSAQGNANGQPFLATPFVNALTGQDNVYFISQNFADPALSASLTGGVGVFSATSLWSWEVNGAANVVRNREWTIDLLGGFRQASLKESLNYVTSVDNLTKGGASLFLLTPIDPGFVVTTFDGFSTRNTFNGGQFGARIDHRWGFLSVEVVGKLAMGSMHEVVNIQGMTTTNAPLPVTQAVGGIYAQGSNIGNYTRDVFAVVPEVGVNLAVQLTGNLKARMGYTFLYLSNVVRPGRSNRHADQYQSSAHRRRLRHAGRPESSGLRLPGHQFLVARHQLWPGTIVLKASPFVGSSDFARIRVRATRKRSASAPSSPLKKGSDPLGANRVFNVFAGYRRGLTPFSTGC